MRKILILAALASALSVTAQPAGHFLNVAHTNPFSSKSNYLWKMTDFHTSDNYQLCGFSYDGYNRLVAMNDSVRGEYSVVDSMFYDEAGNMVRLSGWQRLNGTMQNVYYIDYTYNDLGLIASRSNYNNFNGVWELGGVYNYSYDENGKIVLTTLTMGNMIYQKIEYAYDEDKCVSELWYSYYFDAETLLPSEKYVNSYSNGHLILKYDSISDDGVNWQYNGRYNYIYDDQGNCTEYHHYDRQGHEVERSVYTYDESKPLESTIIPWNPEIDRPRNYDNVNVCAREAWYSLDVDYVLQYVCDYIYDYATMGSGIESTSSASVMMAPNPATKVVSISGLTDENVQVQIVDAAGRIATTAVVNVANSNVDISGLVSGCYVVRLMQHGLPQSLKLVVK